MCIGVLFLLLLQGLQNNAKTFSLVCLIKTLSDRMSASRPQTLYLQDGISHRGEHGRVKDRRGPWVQGLQQAQGSEFQGLAFGVLVLGLRVQSFTSIGFKVVRVKGFRQAKVPQQSSRCLRSFNHKAPQQYPSEIFESPYNDIEALEQGFGALCTITIMRNRPKQYW